MLVKIIQGVQIMEEPVIQLDQPEVSRQTQKGADAIRQRHALGMTINAVTKTPKGKCKYGLSSVPTFARNDGSSDSYTYDSRQFATAYTLKQLEKLVDQTIRYNAEMGPSHAIELSRIKNRRIRSRFQTKAARERWSVDRLQQEIRDMKLGA
jgi:hypothetical protein